MESRLRSILLSAVLLIIAVGVLPGCASKLTTDSGDDAESSVIEPEVSRRQIEPPKINTNDFEIGAYAGLMSVEDFGSNAVYGASLAYHMSEHFFFQGNYGQTDTSETSFEVLSGGAQLLTDDQRQLSYYDLLIGYNLLPGEAFIGSSRSFNSAMYMVAGVGNTDFADDKFFTLVFGAGYRMLLWDYLAVNFDVRDHMFDSDLLGTDKTTHNIEFKVGMTFFF
jgi:outer membrane beta-barrel protein